MRGEESEGVRGARGGASGSVGEVIVVEGSWSWVACLERLARRARSLRHMTEKGFGRGEGEDG